MTAEYMAWLRENRDVSAACDAALREVAVAVEGTWGDAAKAEIARRQDQGLATCRCATGAVATREMEQSGSKAHTIREWNLLGGFWDAEDRDDLDALSGSVGSVEVWA